GLTRPLVPARRPRGPRRCSRSKGARTGRPGWLLAPIRNIRCGLSLCYITVLSRTCDLPRFRRRIISASPEPRTNPILSTRRRGWEIPETRATPEPLFLNRRAFMVATGAAAISLSPELALAQRVADLPDPTANLYPVKRNEKYVLDRPITDE